MEMTPLLILLCLGVFHFTFAFQRLRYFSCTEDTCFDEDEFTGGAEACKKINASVVTLFDDEDVAFTVRFQDNKKDLSFWLGLQRRNLSLPTNISYYANDSSVTDKEQRCGAFNSSSRTFSLFECSEKKPFMCSRGDNYTLVKEGKDWCQALHHCRTHYTDLVTRSNIQSNMELMTEEKNTSFWIGELHDHWEWHDKSCSTFRKLTFNDENCTFFESKEKPIVVYECNNKKVPFCSNGTLRIRVVNISLTWEEAYDYCRVNHTRMLCIEDAEDQKAVSQWLDGTDYDKLWIGLRQSIVFGFWIWENRTVEYPNWKNGLVPEMPQSEHCGVIEPSENNTWTDEDCYQRHPFICEEYIVYLDE